MPFSKNSGDESRSPLNLDLLSAYDFVLPERLIAQTPSAHRADSRLMVLDRARQSIEHCRFSDLPRFLRSGDLLVGNNTSVIPARLKGHRPTGGKIEFLLLEQLESRVWEGICKSSANQVPGLEFQIPTRSKQKPMIHGTLVRGSKDSPTGTVVARFDFDPIDEVDCGEIPLPPYITRDESGPSSEDRDRYETVYAKEKGSAAAPTAGLHFTPQIMEQLRDKNVEWREVTLHIGLGTFRPVKVEALSDHPMHFERYWIPSETQQSIQSRKGRLIAVGTTSVRTIEGSKGSLSGRTNLFIRPGHHQFQSVEGMITNFHLPQSTLLMLVSAFAGYDFTMRAYREAVQERYRFFSFGDAMLIL